MKILPSSPRFHRALASVAVTLSLLISSPFLVAQGVVSSGINGSVVDSGGRPVAGATVTATHVPTGTSETATSRDDGQYGFRGLMAGGPYTVSVSASGFATDTRQDVFTELAQNVGVNFQLQTEGKTTEIVKLQAFTVNAAATDLDGGMTGASSSLAGSRLENIATVQRSFADLARASTLVTLRNIDPQQGTGQITALGQNSRFNSVQLDGARINDQYGLNDSGLQSFANPISLDTIEQVNISVSPYDVRQSGFTGASINAVTKSGTNKFKGSLYAYYTDQDLQGKDEFGPSAGTKPALRQKTYGFTFGGPIVKNRLFFFLNYERFTSDTAPSQPGYVPDASALSLITTRLSAINAAAPFRTEFGSFGAASASNRQLDEKRLIKFDWKISSGHRFSVRGNETKGELPQYTNYAAKALFTGLAPLNLTAPVGTALSSNFFNQTRTEKVIAAQLFDSWTESLKTEVHYARTTFEQLTPVNSIFPEVRIFGVPGVAATGAVSNGYLALGTEIGRQGNTLRVNTTSYSITGDYFFGKFTFSGGFDREESKFYNLFRSASYGVFDYASIADFQNDKVAAFNRALYVQGTPVDEITKFSISGLSLQAKYEVSSRLSLLAGVREDFFASPLRPLFNAPFAAAFGVRNDGTVDGNRPISPRLSFNLSVDAERKTQVRGGYGLFQGRAPWVYVNNSYGNTGVGRYTTTTIPAGGLSGYVASGFDPKNPIGTAATDIGGRRVINLMVDKLKMPSVWRGNLAVDHKLAFLSSTLSLEGVVTRTESALFLDNMNVKPLIVTATSGPATGLDGRPRFNGSAAGAGAVNTAFSNVIRLRNIRDGGSQYLTLGWDRPMKGTWSASFSYSRGRARDLQSAGNTVAAQGWTNTVIFAQNTPELSRSDFEVRDRVQISGTKEFEWIKKAKTSFTLSYEGRTGNPYSWVYTGDLNNDGVAGNDAVYVPNGASDPVMDYSQMTPAQRDAMLAFIDGSELAKYKGRVVPRNAFYQPWVNRLDLHVSQLVPIADKAQVEVFADMINFGSLISSKVFGYYEKIPDFRGTFARRFLGNAAYGPDGRIRPTYTETPAGALGDNLQSRWRLQFGARVKF